MIWLDPTGIPTVMESNVDTKNVLQQVKDAEQACRNYQQRVSRSQLFLVPKDWSPLCILTCAHEMYSSVQIRELENELGNEKRASRNSARSSRPPLVPPRQRQPQGRNNSYIPPSGPSRWRLKDPTINNKENIPVGMKKPNPVDDPNKAVGRARRVSLTPVMRQIPTQPKRRSSMAILPSVREHFSVLNEKRGGSQLPRASVATFGVNLVPGTPLAGYGGPVDATPDGAKYRRFDFGSSSKFTSPPQNVGTWNKMVTPQQKLGMAPAGPANAAKLCFSIQKRVTPPRVRATPPPRVRATSGLGIFDAALRENMAVGITGKARRVLNAKRRQSVL